MLNLTKVQGQMSIRQKMGRCGGAGLSCSRATWNWDSVPGRRTGRFAVGVLNFDPCGTVRGTAVSDLVAVVKGRESILGV